MTSNIDFVRDYLERAWKDVPTSLLEAMQETFADDFQSIDVNGSVTMDKEAYIGGGQMMDDFLLEQRLVSQLRSKRCAAEADQIGAIRVEVALEPAGNVGFVEDIESLDQEADGWYLQALHCPRRNPYAVVRSS